MEAVCCIVKHYNNDLNTNLLQFLINQSKIANFLTKNVYY